MIEINRNNRIQFVGVPEKDTYYEFNGVRYKHTGKTIGDKAEFTARKGMENQWIRVVQTAEVWQ